MFRFKIVFFTLVFALPSMRGQGVFSTAANAGSAGLGGVTTCLTGIYATTANPAGITGSKNFEGQIFFERRFLLEAFTSMSGGINLPTNAGVFGFALRHFGFSAYSEQQVGLLYARKFWEKLEVGAGFNYFQFNIAEHGSKGILSFDLGLQSSISKTFTLGILVKNPARVEIIEGEKLPTTIALGGKYLPSNKVTFFIEFEKDLLFEVKTKTGFEYQPLQFFSIRAGFATNPTNYSFGAGYQFKNGFGFDFAAVHHQILGITPAIGVYYSKRDAR